MYAKQFALGLLATVLVSVHAQNNNDNDELDNNDVPPECRQICGPLIQLTQRCDQQHDNDDDNNNINDDQAERDCVCNDQGAQQLFQDCGSCVARYPNYFIDLDDDDGTNDNEVAQWAQQCNIAIANATGSPTITSGPSGTGSCSTVQVTTTFRDDDDDDDDQNDWRTATITSVQCGPATQTPSTSTSVLTVNGTPSTVLVQSTPTGSTNQQGTPPPQQTGGAAAGFTAPLAYAGAGACFLLAAFAL